jgi:hypothetical protein
MIALAIAGLVGWVVGAMFFGLWLGERGRRMAAERRETHGTPLEPQAARLPDQADSESLARTVGRAEANARFSEDTVLRGMAQLKAEAESIGQTLSDVAARAQALAMLHGTLETEPDVVELGG